MAESFIQVTLCWSFAPRDVQVCDLRVPLGCTVQGVLDQGISQSRQHVAGETVQHGVPHGASGPSSMDSLRFQQPGVWGRKVTWAHIVEDGDRVELYRPLKVDPKVARRQRFKRQGKGRTGLFAKRKSGAAAGY
jgi:putative ubiquitin-RnfH superfamily antitoxin RatB of RatAB toxin-antitoxin module